MKTLILLLLIISPFFIYAQTGITWTEASSVSTAQSGRNSPKIALLADGRPLVIWGKGQGIYMAKWENDAFGPTQLIPTTGTTPSSYNFGGLDLAVHGETIYIVYEDYPEGIFVIRSDDNGATFNTPVQAYASPAGRAATLANIEVSADGQPIAYFLGTTLSETEALYLKVSSTDFGDSFEAPITMNSATNSLYVCECCPASMNILGDTLLVAFRNNRDNIRDTWVARSTDGGLNFDAATDIDDTDWEIFGCPHSGPSNIVFGDSLYSVWMSGANNESQVYLSSLNYRNMQAGQQIPLPAFNASNVTQNHPDIAGDAQMVGMVWEELIDGQFDIVFSYSQNGIADLVHNRINLSNAPSSQLHADLVYDGTQFHVVYANSANNEVTYHRGELAALTVTREVETLERFVYPNPVSCDGHFQIQDIDMAFFSLSILNINGQVLRQFDRVERGEDIAVKGLAAGMYHLLIEQGGEIRHLPLVVY